MPENLKNHEGFGGKSGILLLPFVLIFLAILSGFGNILLKLMNISIQNPILAFFGGIFAVIANQIIIFAVGTIIVLTVYSLLCAIGLISDY